jgi:hypothetical protein
MSTSLTGGGTSNLDALTVAGAADFGSPTYGSVAMGRMVLGTAQATTSGTSIDFTGIPSWVKRITLSLAGVSTNGVSNPLLQIGGGSVETTGYTGFTWNNSSGGSALASTGFNLFSASASAVIYGSFVLTNVSPNLWTIAGTFTASGSSIAMITTGAKTTSSALDRIRLTTVNGTDTFDAGSVNILYEG